MTYYSELNLQHPTYYIYDELAVGRIEICLQGIWNPVCEDFLTDDDASVACYQLGFSRAGKLFILYFLLIVGYLLFCRCH